MTCHQATVYEGDRGRNLCRLLTVNDVAATLAISRDTVYRLVRSGALSTVRVGERIRIREDDLQAYLDRETEAAP